MEDWYYHAPGEGRVGPYSAEDLRKRYRERRIALDTLVWRHGLREWQPLERVADEIGLAGVVPDAALPPPMPPGVALNATPVHAPGPRTPISGGRYSRSAAPAPARSGLSGCAIVAIVCAVAALPVFGILAAIAIPAYNDYTQRAKLMPVLVAQGNALKGAVEQHVGRHGGCPHNGSPGFAELARQAAQSPQTAAVQFGRLEDGTCAFEITLRNVGADADGKTVLFAAYADNGAMRWDCSGGDLPARYRPSLCRASTGP